MCLGVFQDQFEDIQGLFRRTDNIKTIKPLSLDLLKVFLVDRMFSTDDTMLFSFIPVFYYLYTRDWGRLVHSVQIRVVLIINCDINLILDLWFPFYVLPTNCCIVLQFNSYFTFIPSHLLICSVID